MLNNSLAFEAKKNRTEKNIAKIKDAQKSIILGLTSSNKRSTANISEVSGINIEIVRVRSLDWKVIELEIKKENPKKNSDEIKYLSLKKIGKTRELVRSRRNQWSF